MRTRADVDCDFVLDILFVGMLELEDDDIFVIVTSHR